MTKIFAALVVSLLSAASSPGQSVAKKEWGKLSNGETVQLFTLKTGSISAEIATYGAQIVSLRVPDKEGKITNVVLGHPDVKSAETGETLGAVIGRYANRISGGGFEIDGKRYDLESVNPRTKIQIHGGKTGFQHQNWEVEENPEKVGFTPCPSAVTLRLFSPDGHEGYPGNLKVWVQYRITPPRFQIFEGNRIFSHVGNLEMEFRAQTDQATHVNLTNHSYFNLAGGGTIQGHSIESYSTEVLESDERNIPTGKFLPVESIGLDLSPKSGDSKGFDHCLVTPEHGTALSLYGGKGLTLSVTTTQPGVQIYTANHFKNNPFPKFGAICFETQHFPDTPNQPGFPSTLLRPGEWLEETTSFELQVYDPVPF